jgi:hypothetical protein
MENRTVLASVSLVPDTTNPDKWRLFEALGASSGSDSGKVTFAYEAKTEEELRNLQAVFASGSVKPKGSFKTQILGIMREDGSGRSWCVTGSVQGKTVDIYYHSEDKKGHIKFVK